MGHLLHSNSLLSYDALPEKLVKCHSTNYTASCKIKDDTNGGYQDVNKKIKKMYKVNSQYVKKYGKAKSGRRRRMKGDVKLKIYDVFCIDRK